MPLLPSGDGYFEPFWAVVLFKVLPLAVGRLSETMAIPLDASRQLQTRPPWALFCVIPGSYVWGFPGLRSSHAS